MANIQDLSCGKMSPVPSPQIKEKISKQSSMQSARSNPKGMLFLCLKMVNGQMQETSWQMISPLRGECSMLNIGEYPNEENVSTLSQILQVGVPEKYYLSQRACQGILRRASARGKELPELLRKALLQQALMDTTEV